MGGSRVRVTTIPEISGADSTTSFFRMGDVVGAEEDEEEEEEVGTEEEEDDGVYGGYGGREAKEDTTVDPDTVDTVGREAKEGATFRCLVEMLEQKMKKKKMACTVIMGETMVGREARVATTVGDYSFYSEVQGIVALFGGRDYLGDADEVVGYYGGKGGKGSKGGYGFYEENVIP